MENVLEYSIYVNHMIKENREKTVDKENTAATTKKMENLLN